MKKIDTFSSLVLILFGLIYCYSSIKTGLGRINAPGSGLIPFGTAALLVLFALGTIAEARLGSTTLEANRPLFRGKQWGAALSVLAAMLAYALLLGALGFVATTFLILTFLFRISEGSSWKMALGASVLTTAFSYFLFVYLLRCSFPKGFLGI